MRLPMSVEEVWVTIISTILAIFFWSAWYISTAMLWPDRERPSGLLTLWLAPLLAAALVMAVLTTFAAHDVVDDIRYINMYFALGLSWVGIATRAFPLSGLHMRDDAIERRNPAVAPAIAGAIIGIAASYAGANIGSGPGWWVVVVSASIATAGLLLTWQALEALTGVAEAVTVERDVAAGWRLGGFLVAAGIVLGRSVAGDWVSLEVTLADFVRSSWPVLGLLALATLFERTMRVSVTAPSRAVSSHGVLPAVGMIGLAIGWLLWLGVPQ